MRRVQKGLYFLLFFVLTLAFQNCGGGFQPLLSEDVLSKLGSKGGNGGGYEGKPDGTYYRYVPNYLCSGQSSAQAIAEIKSGQAYLFDNTKDQCAQQSTPVSPADLNMSPFQSDYISVKDALFKRYEVKPAGIPQDLAEILCRDDYENPQFEIVSHFDRQTHEAQSKVYFADHTEADFSVGRILSASDVRYVSEKLEFTVDLSKPAQAVRKFSGRIKSSTIPGLAASNLTCVIGGSLDTTGWKITQLSTIPTGGFYFLGPLEILFYHTVSNWFDQLYIAGANNSLVDFTQKYFNGQATFRSTLPTPDKNLRFFQMRWTSDIYDSSYLYKIDQKTMTRLTNLQAGPPQGTMLVNPQVTDSQHLIYGEYEQFGTTLFRDLNLNTMELHEFFNEKYPPLVLTLHHANKVVLYSASQGDPRILKIYDPATRLTTNLTVQLDSTCSLGTQAWFAARNDQSLIASAHCSGNPITSTIDISLTDGTVRFASSDQSLLWISPEYSWMFFGDSTAPRAYNTSTGKTFPVPINPTLMAFTGILDGADSHAASEPKIIAGQWMYGLGGDQQLPSLYQVDLNTGASLKMCENTLGRKLLIGTLKNDRAEEQAYLFTYDKTLQLYRFYLVQGENNCALINQFPSLYTAARQIMTTSIGFTLQIGNPENMAQDSAIKEIVFLPVDGRPPVKLNWNDIGPWQAQVAPEKNRIILTGPDPTGVQMLYSFDLF